VARSVAGTVTVSSVELTNVGVRKAPFTETNDPGVKPVPFKVSVKLGPPVHALTGLRLLSVSGVFVVLKFANTSVSSVAVKLSGFVVPVRSYVQPANVQVASGVAV